MFFDEQCDRESIFGKLARASNNLLAIKVDGATKEEFVWGLRVGFITFGDEERDRGRVQGARGQDRGPHPRVRLEHLEPGPVGRPQGAERPGLPQAAGREGRDPPRPRGDRPGREPQGRVRRLLGRLPLQLRLLHVRPAEGRRRGHGARPRPREHGRRHDRPRQVASSGSRSRPARPSRSRSSSRRSRRRPARSAASSGAARRTAASGRPAGCTGRAVRLFGVALGPGSQPNKDQVSGFPSTPEPGRTRG